MLEGKSGGEVVPTVQKDAPDVVLMDLRTPDQSGMQALESVHRHALPEGRPLGGLEARGHRTSTQLAPERMWTLTAFGGFEP